MWQEFRSSRAGLPQANAKIEELLHEVYEEEKAFDGFSAGYFRGLNIRGITGYDMELFGWDPLSVKGFYVEDDERILGRMIKRLRFGGVVADWGGGAGIFAYEARKLRPDLRTFINDLHPLEDILANSELPVGIEPRDLQTGVTRLVGDALSVELPEGKKADLLVSCLLAPYLPDPFRLISHMYNQLRPGGILVTTFPSKTIDATQWTLGRDHIFPELVWDLRRQGIAVATPNKDHTLVMRRLDDRHLDATAELLQSHLAKILLNWNSELREIRQYISYFRPGGAPPHRWFTLRD